MQPCHSTDVPTHSTMQSSVAATAMLLCAYQLLSCTDDADCWC